MSFSPSALRLTSVIMHLNISQEVRMLYSLGRPSAVLSFIHTTLKKEVKICLTKVDMTFRRGRAERREGKGIYVCL